MDLEFDVNSLCFGLVAMQSFKNQYDSLCGCLSGISLSSELSTAGLLDSARSRLKRYNDTFVDIISRGKKVRSELEKFDDEARLLFSMVDEGILNVDGTLNDIPLFDQTDYTNVRYSMGTIATSGSGITALSMLATYLQSEIYTPEELAKLGSNVQGHEVTNVGRMLTAADKIGLKYTEATTKDVLPALKEGKSAIILINGSTHFVAVVGLTDDGKWIVRDPYGPTYFNSFQKDRLENGYAMSVGASGYPSGELNISNGRAWIFESTETAGKTKLEVDIETPKFLFDL